MELMHSEDDTGNELNLLTPKRKQASVSQQLTSPKKKPKNPTMK